MRFVWALLWAVVVVAAVWAEEKDMDSLDEIEADDRIINSTDSSTDSTTSPAVTTPTTSSSRPVDCADLLLAGSTTSGVYEIYPFSCSSCSQPVIVWCDMETDGGGWTIFLSRQEASQQLDFNRTWNDYKAGFGSPYEEHYMGNNMLHVMTQSRGYTLRLNLEHVTGGSTYATYETFRVNDEEHRFQTYVSGRLHGSSTTTTYCLRYMSGRYFTTFDRDNDYYSGNCAAKQGGGWWYYNCRPYFNPTRDGFNSSMELKCYTSYKFQVTKLQLMIRPQICDATFKTIHLRKMQGCGCQDP